MLMFEALPRPPVLRRLFALLVKLSLCCVRLTVVLSVATHAQLEVDIRVWLTMMLR